MNHSEYSTFDHVLAELIGRLRLFFTVAALTTFGLLSLALFIPITPAHLMFVPLGTGLLISLVDAGLNRRRDT